MLPFPKNRRRAQRKARLGAPHGRDIVGRVRHQQPTASVQTNRVQFVTRLANPNRLLPVSRKVKRDRLPLRAAFSTEQMPTPTAVVPPAEKSKFLSATSAAVGGVVKGPHRCCVEPAPGADRNGDQTAVASGDVRVCHAVFAVHARAHEAVNFARFGEKRFVAGKTRAHDLLRHYNTTVGRSSGRGGGDRLPQIC